MSEVGAKISAAISRHNEKREHTLTLAEKLAQDREAITGVAAGLTNRGLPAVTQTASEKEGA